MNEKEVVKIVLNELEKRNVIKHNFSTYKNTEQILRDYPMLKKSITDRQEQIKEYKQFGLQEKSKSITSINLNQKREDEEDIINDSIKSLQKHIFKTKVIIEFIDKILSRFKDDPYFDVIKLHYFDNMTYDQIAEIFDKRKNNNKNKLTAGSTIGSNNQRLVREIQKYLFPNDYLFQLFGY